MGILNKIKQKPDSQKRVISLVFSLVITIFVVGIWYSFSEKKGSTELSADEQSKLSSLSPIQVIKDEFSRMFADIKQGADVISSTTLDNIPIEIFDEETASTSEAVGTSTSLKNILNSSSSASTTNNSN